MYEFLEKARLEPDLQDVVQYLNKPLNRLEELLYKYEQINLQAKTKLENMEVYRRIDKILHQHLPYLIDTYCNFSISYRNTKLIKQIKEKEELKNYTAKDLLLRDLSKIMEEINILEDKFNDNNKVHFLVNNRILSDFGNQTEILPSKQQQQVAVQLENKFNYQNYEHVFVKPNTSTPQAPPVVNLVEKQEDDIKTSENFFELLSGMLLVTGFIVLALFLIFTIGNIVHKNNNLNSAYELVLTEKHNIEKDIALYSTALKVNPKGDLITANKIMNPQKNSFSGYNQITQLNPVTQKYSATITNLSSNQCEGFIKNYSLTKNNIKLNNNAHPTIANCNISNTLELLDVIPEGI